MKCPRCHFENPTGTKFCGECGTQLIPSDRLPDASTKTLQIPVQELSRGITFAKRFEVIEELGKGGMGTVYRVVDNTIREEVALKILKPEVASDEKTIGRFRNELKFARKISHKNVCRMYDINEEEGTQYITMEYVPGEDLKSTITRVGQLSIGKTVSIAKQVSEGLAEAHQLGVIHRDLKPQNIMVDKAGNARIMDFGIARSLKTKGITDASVIIGTPEYMSPEQVEGKDIDARSDIYSLGIILYEMLTGRVPFEGETPFSIAVKHKNEIPLAPKEFNSLIPDDLNGVILKCIEKNKDKRYQTTEELISDLNKIERGLPTTERMIPRKKPLTHKEITVLFSLKKLYIPALVILGVVLTAIVIWRLLPHPRAVPFPADKPSLAVMYFENNTGDISLNHWRKALSDLLIADLSQSKYLSILSGERLFNILEDLNLLESKSYSSEDLEKVGERGGVQHVLVGKIAMAGAAFRIDVMLQKASTGELVGSQRVEGKGEESFFSMVDELTKKVKENFRLSEEEIASDIDKQVGEITTSSPEAHAYYRDGMEYFNKGDYIKSIPLMEMAVAIDPEFAMAYRNMAVAYTNIGYRSEARKRLQKAFELSDHVSERERYYIQGVFYSQTEKTFDKAIEAYKKLLELYPDDVIGNNNLGMIYANLEDWDKALKQVEVNIQKRVSSVLTYRNVVALYLAKGLFGKARDVLEDYLHDFSDNAIIRNNLALTHLCQGKYNLALTEADKSLLLDPNYYYNHLLKGEAYLYKGDLVSAKREFNKLLEIEEPPAHNIALRYLAALYGLQGKYEESIKHIKQGIDLAEMLDDKEWELWFHLYLAYVNQKKGNFEEAVEECNQAWTSSDEAENAFYQRKALYFKGLTHLEKKSINEAQKTADELKVLIDTGLNRKAIRYYYHLIGLFELENKNYSKAVEFFNKALSLLPSPSLPDFENVLHIDSLALTHYKAGEVEKAQKEYEKILSFTRSRLYYGDIYAESHYRLGKIFQEKGWKGKAIEHYEQFLNLSKNADPGVKVVSEAKQKLKALKSQ